MNPPDVFGLIDATSNAGDCAASVPETTMPAAAAARPMLFL
jgi:hypothetical protein